MRRTLFVNLIKTQKIRFRLGALYGYSDAVRAFHFVSRAFPKSRDDLIKIASNI